MSKVISPLSHHKNVCPPICPAPRGTWALWCWFCLYLEWYCLPPLSRISLWEGFCCLSTWVFLLHCSWLQIKLYVADRSLICCSSFEFLDLNRLWTESCFMGTGQWCNRCYLRKKKKKVKPPGFIIGSLFSLAFIIHSSNKSTWSLKKQPLWSVRFRKRRFPTSRFTRFLPQAMDAWLQDSLITASFKCSVQIHVL